MLSSPLGQGAAFLWLSARYIIMTKTREVAVRLDNVCKVLVTVACHSLNKKPYTCAMKFLSFQTNLAGTRSVTNAGISWPSL